MNFGCSLAQHGQRLALGFIFLGCALAARADQAASYSIGSTVQLTVTADGTEPFFYQWKKDGVDIPGARSATYSVVNATSGDSARYTATVTNAVGSTLSDAAIVSVGVGSPVVVAQSSSQTIESGSSTTLSVTVSGTPAPTVQWRKNGVAIAGANGTTLTLTGASAADAGSYSVVVTNSVGSVTSNVADITVLPSTSRLVNVSIRTVPGTGAQTLIVGFVTSGDNKTILVRGVGPGLAPYTASPTLADPLLELYDGSASTPFATNARWGGTPLLRGTFARLGAFALSDTSDDTSILATLAPRVYSAQLRGDGRGLAIAEIYDADAAGASTGRIVNLSARTQVNTGDGVLIAGFVIAGNAPKKLLIRAVGPTLGSYGVPGALVDPKLDLFAAGGSTPIQSNDNWAGDTNLAAAFAAAGAFALSDSSSKDSAMIVTLNPGAYSAVVSGVGNTTGVALIEIYELP